MSDPTAPSDDFRAAVRRVAAYGAITRMTGFRDLVTLDDDELVVNDGDERLCLRRDSDGLTGVITADWAGDAAAERMAVDWIEEYVENTQQYLVIRRDYVTDLITDPFSDLYLQRLAGRFPAADLPDIEDFLRDVAHWLPAPPAA